MNKAIERQIKQIFTSIYNSVFNAERTSLLSRGSRLDIVERLTMLPNTEKYNEFAEKVAIELAKKGLYGTKGLWRNYYEAAKKAHYVALPSTYKAFEMQALSKAVKHNFEMIKSIPSRMMEILEHKYTSTLIEEVAKGTISRNSFRNLLYKHGQKRAGVIARTETAKLQTAITRNRALDVGAVAYIWRSSNDKRTRPSHRAMNGVIVFWRPDSQKPLLDNMRGDAGEFPNCRCDAEPIVDINDLTNNRYKVYDYQTDSIIWMSRQNLIKAIMKAA